MVSLFKKHTHEPLYPILERLLDRRKILEMRKKENRKLLTMHCAIQRKI